MNDNVIFLWYVIKRGITTRFTLSSSVNRKDTSQIKFVEEPGISKCSKTESGWPTADTYFQPKYIQSCTLEHIPQSTFYLPAWPLPCFCSPPFGYTSFMWWDDLIAIQVINAEDEVDINIK